MGAFASKLPFVGAVAGSAIAAVGGISTAFLKLTELATGAPRFLITSLDDQTRGLRQFEGNMFDLHKRFGGTIDEAKRFSDTMRMASGNELAQSLHLTTNEMADFVRKTGDTSLTQEQLSQVVQTGAGAIELFGAATAFAKASSMDLGTAARLLNNLMNKQGKSAQEATNMLGMYVGVAEKTGLSIDKVSSSLNSAVQNFAKIGMAADFGKPIMEGFASTMTDMGLGIEESIALSEGLTKSLAGLANNYGLAHLTFQRGGLDIGGGGGGGVLGAGIAMQSAFLEADKTGDQAAIGDQLVRGMRDTLASFTGGDIVTVQQANEDSSLQSQFYIQQQMLKTSFGLGDDNSAARVLDMLSRLDEATRTGDVDAQESLKKQIANEKKGRDLTLDEMEKVNRKLETQINLMTVDLRNSLDQTRRMAAGTGAAVVGQLPKVIGAASAGVELQGSAIERAADFLFKNMGQEGEKDFAKKQFEDFKVSKGPMNSVGAVSGGIALGHAATEGLAPGEANDLVDILSQSSGSGTGKNRKFMSTDTVGSEIDRIAGIIAAQSPEGERGQVRKSLVDEFKLALKEINVNIKMDDNANSVFNASADIADSVRKYVGNK
jgi:hypothetical protein